MNAPIGKRIVCLANSRKLSGRCVAGKTWPPDSGGSVWVRPVSSRPHQEVSEHERRYQDGSDPRVLHIVDVPLLQPCPVGYQSENWLLDPRFNWAKAGEIGWGELAALQDAPGPLWVNGDSTYHGLNDRMVESVAMQQPDSLRLFPVDELELSVFVPGAAFGESKRRVQGHFLHAGVRYRLWVTDPVYEGHCLALSDGTYRGSVLTCVQNHLPTDGGHGKRLIVEANLPPPGAELP